MYKYVNYSADKIKSMRWACRVAHMGRGEVDARFLEVKPEGKRQLGTPRSRWDEHIQKDFQ
jgi:hypothetical protein